VLWDAMCLEEGKKWENGFLSALNSCKVVVVLCSDMAWKEAISKSQNCEQDNYLLECELAHHMAITQAARVKTNCIYLHTS
jgi:hypothetical protein